MSRDSSSTYLHLHSSHHADLLESFTHPHNSTLSPEEIYIPPHLQPVNPEDEDDVVPDQHAAFGIQQATLRRKEASWRDLGLEELVRRGPGQEVIGAGNAASTGAGAAGGGAAAGAGVGAGGRGRSEPVALALRRRPGTGRGRGVPGAAGRFAGEGGQVGGGAGNGLPR